MENKYNINEKNDKNGNKNDNWRSNSSKENNFSLRDKYILGEEKYSSRKILFTESFIMLLRRHNKRPLSSTNFSYNDFGK